MKLLNWIQQNQISGGSIITVNGQQNYVNTVGIPNTCVTQYETMLQAISKECDNPNRTFSSILKVIGAHMDKIDSTGCSYYMEKFSNNYQKGYVI